MEKYMSNLIDKTRDIDAYTQTYLEHDFEDVMVHYRRQKVLEILNLYKPKRILEIGSGLQSIFDFYHDYDSFTIVEPSDVFCESIRKSSFFNEKVTVIKGFFEREVSCLRNEPFDFILISSLLHEVADPFLLLESVLMLCDFHTFVHINVPNSESFHLFWAFEAGLVPQLNQLTDTARSLQQQMVFNQDKLIEICGKVGFEIIEKGSYFVKPFNHKKMAACLNTGIIDSQLLEGLYTLTKYFPKNGAEIYVNCKKVDAN
jgi:hypothetical protein